MAPDSDKKIIGEKTIRNSGHQPQPAAPRLTAISTAGGNSAIHNNGCTIGMLANSGTISAGGYYGILNDGTIGTLINSGTITGGGFYGIVNESGGTIGALTNS